MAAIACLWLTFVASSADVQGLHGVSRKLGNANLWQTAQDYLATELIAREKVMNLWVLLKGVADDRDPDNEFGL